MKFNFLYVMLALIVSMGIILRIMLPQSSPPGFSEDEAALGYNAYSLLLTGRDEHGVLFPFSLEEVQKTSRSHLSSADGFVTDLLQSKKLPDKFVPIGKWILGGGYPEVVLNRRMSRKLWFSSYLQTYVDRDVRGYVRQSNLHDFERFVKLLAELSQLQTR